MKTKRRAPNALRKWANGIDGFEIHSCANGMLQVYPVYVDGVTRHPESCEAGDLVGQCSLGVRDRWHLAADVKRVLSKALREAKG